MGIAVSAFVSLEGVLRTASRHNQPTRTADAWRRWRVNLFGARSKATPESPRMLCLSLAVIGREPCRRNYLDPSNIVIAVTGPIEVIRKHASPEERVLLEGKG